MTKSKYVSIDVAKLLKTKEFDEPCDRFYCDMYKKVADCTSPSIRFSKVTYKVLDDEDILIPTLYDANEWLRNRGIFITISPIWSNAYDIVEYRARIVDRFDLMEGKKGKLMPFISDLYEDELNCAIREAIKKL